MSYFEFVCKELIKINFSTNFLNKTNQLASKKERKITLSKQRVSDQYIKTEKEMEPKTILKIVVILDGLIVMIVPIIRFVYSSDQKPWSLKDQIWNFYWIVFGLMIILAEFNLKILLTYFNFLETQLGRGLFHIFIGTIMLGLPAYILAIGNQFNLHKIEEIKVFYKQQKINRFAQYCVRIYSPLHSSQEQKHKGPSSDWQHRQETGRYKHEQRQCFKQRSKGRLNYHRLMNLVIKYEQKSINIYCLSSRQINKIIYYFLRHFEKLFEYKNSKKQKWNLFTQYLSKSLCLFLFYL
ncbi:COPI associated protein (macronuclear) [Tetrahymena thermophila SB210]|uniref:COPI associated protein n=1 Tax=Tetrahymena thermophila (strain SB210) TaxID=312017 RepID=Q22RE4_TETTS|nr:COPI associated protein [Tetrahymena thermophila SB210]EAR88178.3 COPI associated protein [Tetrahymena thermophila SB210]|eukprot:XP_001008423.3 COPI associated protein [Tetrahymena thermophila SB210]